MTERTKLFLTALLTLFCIGSAGRSLDFNIRSDGLLDNREYKNDMLPQTIYGLRIMPEASYSDGNGSLAVGLSGIWEFGSDESVTPEIILYCGYNSDRWSAYFGNIPRQRLQRELPEAFLYDSIAFFEPLIGGTLLQYRGEILSTELYCNWYSRQSETRREAFRIVWDGYLENKLFGAGWYAAMTHFAKPKEPGHFIYDKLQLNPYVSLNLADKSDIGLRLRVQAGILSSLIRCRKDGLWHTPTGFKGDIEAGWRMIEVKSVVYTGDRQMPFLDDPEAGMAFHRSDPFYNHTFYNRTGIGITLFSDSNVDFCFRWNMHFTPNSPVHNQQLITVRFNTGTGRKQR